MRNTCLYVDDVESLSLEQKNNVDVVCAGDSITGYNNFGKRKMWPVATYPEFLQEILPELKLVNGGTAGAISAFGIQHIEDYLEIFPSAKYFVIGYGTNDLALPGLSLKDRSENIIGNLDEIVESVVIAGKTPILLNVPYTKEKVLSQYERNFHNQKLKEYCSKKNIGLVDICSILVPEDFIDNLHPNEKGARKISKAVAPLIK
jgi:lysophospholipase L1-like esterase